MQTRSALIYSNILQQYMVANTIYLKIGRTFLFFVSEIQDSVIFQSADECQWVLGQQIRQQSLSLVKSACLQLVSEISSKVFIYEVDCARTGIRAEYFRNR
ncbi:Hypothetical_protein [Hexamita inflata]|uniref:Hypothetical_protein n=1 Tax=Hexamita inflata TaxID=28002 RepID=A0AA86TIE1_9EUKA|nr:Hypothetical protein HINF_LOCUS6075 [Hexamita inflata]CAI9953037.1 Hypothetical protein HINF_LOCUS40682 [Hexamita inflata]